MIFIYNLIFVILMGLIHKNKLKENAIKKRYLIICFGQMALIQGIRAEEVGTDTSSYVSIYENFLSSDYYTWKFTHFEIGFQWLYKFMQVLHLNAQGMLFVISVLMMMGYAIFIYKNSSDVMLSTFIFSCMFFPNSFNVMRQYLALAIAINSYQFIKEKKYFWASILIMIGVSIHMLVILAFIPLLVRIGKNWKTVRNVLLVLCIIFFVAGNQIVNVVLMILGKGYYLEGFNTFRLIRMTTILTGLIAFLSIYFARRENESQNRIEMNCLSCVAYINILAGVLYLKYEFVSRVIEVLNAYIMVMIPLGMNTTKSKYMQIIRLFVYSIPAFLMIMSVYNSGSGVDVYKTFWMK